MLRLIAPSALAVSTLWFVGMFTSRQNFQITATESHPYRRGDIIRIKDKESGDYADFRVYRVRGNEMILRRLRPMDRFFARLRAVRMDQQELVR